MRINKHTGTISAGFRYPHYMSASSRHAQFKQFSSQDYQHLSDDTRATRLVSLYDGFKQKRVLLLTTSSIIFVIVSGFIFYSQLQGSTNVNEFASYTNTVPGARYSIMYPEQLSLQKTLSVDDAITYSNSASDPTIITRASSTFIGDVGINRIDGVLSTLKDQSSALYKNLTSSTTLGQGFSEVRIGTFEGFQTNTISKAVVAPMSFKNSKNRTLVGRLIVVYGAKNQYSFIIGSTQKIWDSNPAAWQTIYNSISVE